MTPTTKLSPRVVVVTGGARGIGRAIAEAFCREGNTVVVTDVLRSEAEKTAAEIGAVSYAMDVRQSREVQMQLRLIAEQCGPIDVLVNNAGVMSRTSVADTDEPEWERVIATNLSGVFNCSHAVIAAMCERRRGWIVNVGSIWAGHVWPNRAAYSASKAGVEQFTRVLAAEVADQGVRVNAVSPGIMASEMTAGVVEDGAFQATFMPRVATGRVGDPRKHLASLVMFLTTPAADYMSGEIVEVHGGYF